MKNFFVLVPLYKFFELGGILKPGMEMRCIEHYPCKFLSKRIKNYRRYPEDAPIKLMHYKIEFTENGLYKKGHVYDALETELGVWQEVKPIIKSD
jgi:hypothetical protein